MSNSKKFFFILPLLFLAIFVFIFFQNNDKEYVDGNELHLPFITENPAKADMLAPAWINNGFVYYLLFRPLVLSTLDPNVFEPGLAKSFTVSEDGLQYRFAKRDNLKWSDGTDLVKEDVLFSIKVVSNSENIDPVFKETFNRIKSIELIGENEDILITLHEQTPSFLAVLSQFVILPKHIFNSDLNVNDEYFWDNPVGSGMYRLASKTDSYYRLEQNPYFVGEKPEIEDIYLHKDPHSILDLYLATNVIDMVDYRSMRGYKEHKLPIDFYRYIAFNIEGTDGYINHAMQDKQTRNAIALAIDNKSILESVYMNIGNLVIFDNHAFDITKAQEALQNSSYDTKRALRLAYYFNDTSSYFFIQAVVKNLEEAGFIVELVKEDSLATLLQKRNYDLLIKDLNILNPSDWHNELHSSNLHSRIYGSNPKLDSLINELRDSLDHEKNKEIIDKLNKIGQERIVRYPLINLDQAIYTSSRLVLPNNFIFPNPWYIVDLKFEDWKILKH